VKRDKFKIIIITLSALVIIEGVAVIWLLLPRAKKPAVVTIAPKGKIAIVIDDWGYHKNTLELVNQIKYPLTAAVLPNLTYSSVIANELHGMGFEIILHLPMEPFEKYRLEKNTLLSSMDEAAITKITGEALASVGFCRGVSNHMGSKLTSDSKAMAVIFKELKKRKLYFLDSLVVSGSVCAGLAGKMNLKFSKRDIFLDNIEEPAYIRAQIHKLKTKAKFSGQAIGIGHDRKITLEVLKEAMPELAKEGYTFVFVSDLVK